jgi:hypothetical protein
MSKRPPVRLTYIGKRISVFGDSTSHAFLKPDGTEVHFGRIAGLYLGHVYEATDSKNGLQLSRRPTSVDQVEIKEKWRDANAAAEERMRQRREAAKATNLINEDLWRTLEPIHRRAAKLSLFEKNAFAEAIVRAIIKGKTK